MQGRESVRLSAPMLCSTHTLYRIFRNIVTRGFRLRRKTRRYCCCPAVRNKLLIYINIYIFAFTMILCRPPPAAPLRDPVASGGSCPHTRGPRLLLFPSFSLLVPRHVCAGAGLPRPTPEARPSLGVARAEPPVLPQRRRSDLLHQERSLPWDSVPRRRREGTCVHVKAQHHVCLLFFLGNVSLANVVFQERTARLVRRPPRRLQACRRRRRLRRFDSLDPDAENRNRSTPSSGWTATATSPPTSARERLPSTCPPSRSASQARTARRPSTPKNRCVRVCERDKRLPDIAHMPLAIRYAAN